jgi:nitrate reductase gamma subunit
MVMLIIWGTLTLIAGVIVSAVGYLSPLPFLGGRERSILLLSLNVAGGLLLLGLFIALGRRYVFRPERWVSVMADGILLTMLTVVVLLGFVMEGLRLAGTERSLEWPVGTLIGWILTLIIGGDAVDVSGFYMAVYMVHAIIAFALLAYLPFSKLFHVFAAQITTYAASEEKKRFRTRAQGSSC